MANVKNASLKFAGSGIDQAYSIKLPHPYCSTHLLALHSACGWGLSSNSICIPKLELGNKESNTVPPNYLAFDLGKFYAYL